MAADWTVVFRRSTAHPAVFSVRDPRLAAEAMAWARRCGFAHRHRAYLLAAELDGWAFLDGGLSYLQSHAHGRLRTGLRVIGWLSLRLLAVELDVVAPRRLLVGEPARHPTSRLHQLLRDGWVASGSATHQAELLVSYVDARGLHDVACALVGVDGAAPVVSPPVVSPPVVSPSVGGPPVVGPPVGGPSAGGPSVAGRSAAGPPAAARF